MFPHNYGFLDGQIRIGLRCYTDDVLGFYNAGISLSCDEIISATHDGGVATLNIYPNPFADELNVEIFDGGVAKLTLYNVHGQQLLDKEFSSTTTFSTGHLPDGMYFYSISHNHKVVKTGKMIRQR